MGLYIYKGLIWYTQRVFLKAIFDTLMMKQATKQKLLPVGYGDGSILKLNYRRKFNTFRFVCVVLIKK